MTRINISISEKTLKLLDEWVEENGLSRSSGITIAINNLIKWGMPHQVMQMTGEGTEQETEKDIPQEEIDYFDYIKDMPPEEKEEEILLTRDQVKNIYLSAAMEHGDIFPPDAIEKQIDKYLKGESLFGIDSIYKHIDLIVKNYAGKDGWYLDIEEV